MIISRTSHRVSFAGDGSELPNFYRREGGVLLCATIRQQFDIEGNLPGRRARHEPQHGGLSLLWFKTDDSVEAEPVPCRPETIKNLEDHLLLVHTNRGADIVDPLKPLSDAQFQTVRRLRDLAIEMRDTLVGAPNLDEFGRLLRQGWEWRRSLTAGNGDHSIEEWYRAAIRAGASGGKLLEADGFLLLMAPPERHEAIIDVLGRPRWRPFAFERRGTQVVPGRWTPLSFYRQTTCAAGGADTPHFVAAPCRLDRQGIA